MDTKVTKQITCYRMHHPRADIERLYINWENYGRGLIKLRLIYKTPTIGLKKYLGTTTDWMLQLVNKHEKQKENIQLFLYRKQEI